MEKKFAEFFSKQASVPPPNRENKLRGWLEEARAEMFQSGVFFSLLQKELYSTIQGNVYRIDFRGHGILCAILAYYEDENELLWLDDHNTNIDFTKFVSRENLLHWLPNNVNKFAKLFVETKLNYLGEPKIVHNVSQIMRAEKEIKRIKSCGSHWQKELQEEERRLDKIAPLLHSPTVTIIDETFRLDFYLWTAILGRVIHIHSTIDTNGYISFSGNQLTDTVGNWFVPR